MHKPSLYYHSKIKSFFDKFTIGGLNYFSFQKHYKGRADKGYYPEERKMLPADFEQHFYGWDKPKFGNLIGSMAMRPSVGGRLKWVCFDLDGKDIRDNWLSKVPQELEKYGLVYILEYGRSKGFNFLDRGKTWIPVNCTIDTARHLFLQIGEDAGLNFYDASDKDNHYYDEIFGVNKVDYLCRLPLGLHLMDKSDDPQVYPIEVGGELTDDPEAFMKAFLEAPQPDEDTLKAFLRPLKTIKALQPVKYEFKGGDAEFLYTPRNLTLPEPLKAGDIPTMLRPVFKNCQAARDVLDGIIHDNYIMDRVKSTHMPGMALSGLCAFNDVRQSKKKKEEITDGKEFFSWIVNEYRDRDDSKHHWDNNWNVADVKGPDRVFMSCKAWDENFGACKGCPWRGQIKSPKQFIYGKPIKRSIAGRIKLTTFDDIRKFTFAAFEKDLLKSLEDREYRTMLLASSMGSGKSFAVSKWTADIAKRGYKVLIAVPTAELALEHQKRLKHLGQSSFILMSHKNIFKYKDELGFSFDCPFYSEIQDQSELGVEAGEYKNRYCKQCPFYNDCYYPRQYAEVKEPEHQIVIIQHAHFSCQEVIYELGKKGFDVLFIDETFTNNIYKSIKVHRHELDKLFESHYDWANTLYAWLMGRELPRGKMKPKETELEKFKKKFKGKDWRVPDFIRFYNQGKRASKYTGIEVVYELPNVPIKVFTDATPPKELLKNLTGDFGIETWGDDEVVDVTRIHPENEIIQVLNSSASRTFLEKDNNLENILHRIGEIVEEQHKDKQVLVTVASKYMQQKVGQFFLDHLERYPTTKTINLMSKGVNTYKDYDVQFLLAGRYSIGRDYMMDIYRYKTVTNFYNRKNNNPEISNPYPVDISDFSSVPIEEQKIRRIEKSGGQGYIYEYEDFNIFTPSEYWAGLCYEYNVNETQQAIRLRFDSSKARKVYILNNYNLPSMMITKSIMLSEFLQS